LDLARSNSWRMCIWLIVCSIAVIGLCVARTSQAQTQAVTLPPGIQMQLKIKDGKTSFKMGEPIDLELTISGDNQGYEVGAWDGDHIVLTPEADVFRWQGLFSSDAVSITELTTKGSTFTTRLNDQYEMKQPGTYTAALDSWRIMKLGAKQTDMPQSMEIVSNTVTFEILPLNEEEEAARVNLLASQIEAASTPEIAKKAWDELAYLTGDAAAREKVRLYLAARNGELAKFPAPDEQAGRFGDVEKALALSKNKKLEIELLHAAWRDVRVAPDEGLLYYMTELARLDAGIGIPDSCGMCAIPRTKWDDTRALVKPYLDEIVASMPLRTGENRKQTGSFLYQELMNSPTSAGFDEARRTVIENFENDSVEEQEEVMQCMQSNQPIPAILHDPTMIRVIEQILKLAAPDGKDSDDETTDLHSCALARLVEVAPGLAVPYFVEEVKNPAAELDLKPFGGLKEATLPQLDQVLLGQIQRFAAEAAKEPGTDVKASIAVTQAQFSLKGRMLLAARYASPAILVPMLELYRQYSAKWDSDQRVATLAYLLRWDAAKTMPLLRAEETPDDNFFSGAVATVGKVYWSIPMPFPPELRADLLQSVAHGSYWEVFTASMELSWHGLPEDEAVLKKRLAAIQAELKQHPEKLNDSVTWGAATGPVGAEGVLIGALRTDHVWHPTEAELIALKQDCLGAFCQKLTTVKAQPPMPGY